MVSAHIKTVALECLQLKTQAVDSPNLKFTSKVVYEIPVTASIAYFIFDEAGYARVANFSSVIAFEAVTANGTVVAADKGLFTVITGNGEGVASAKLVGIAPEEIQRVKEVRARWLYGAR